MKICLNSGSDTIVKFQGAKNNSVAKLKLKKEQIILNPDQDTHFNSYLTRTYKHNHRVFLGFVPILVAHASLHMTKKRMLFNPHEGHLGIYGKSKHERLSKRKATTTSMCWMGMCSLERRIQKNPTTRVSNFFVCEFCIFQLWCSTNSHFVL